jgi:hypothetical protein
MAQPLLFIHTMRIATPLACAALFTVAACSFYGDGDDDCVYYDRGAPVQAYELRDPQSGTCQPYYDNTCDSSCEPCALTGAEAQPNPDWAQCYGACEGLTETACQATPRCRAVYAGTTYHECWGIAPSGPVIGGSCGAFGAYECSLHDDCMAIHDVGTPLGAFRTCAPEGEILQPPPPCSSLDEASCIARTDCTPSYDGHDCTCSSTGCTCQSWSFNSCH